MCALRLMAHKSVAKLHLSAEVAKTFSSFLLTFSLFVHKIALSSVLIVLFRSH